MVASGGWTDPRVQCGHGLINFALVSRESDCATCAVVLGQIAGQESEPFEFEQHGPSGRPPCSCLSLACGRARVPDDVMQHDGARGRCEQIQRSRNVVRRFVWGEVAYRHTCQSPKHWVNVRTNISTYSANNEVL